MAVKYTTLRSIPDYVYQDLNYPCEGKCSDIVLVNRSDCDAYYEAAYECFQMLDAAAEFVIQHEKLSDVGIPEFMHDIIKKTYYDATKHPHMLGRFDFAGGIDGYPIKLIEFNADTPFSIFETSIMQYALCKVSGLDPDNKQYNTVYEELVAFFKYMQQMHPEANEMFFTNHNDGEDDLNTILIMEAAKDAGVTGIHKHWTDIAVDDRYNVVAIESVAIDKSHTGETLYNIKTINHLVKMVPWDLICTYDEKSIEQAKNIVRCLTLRPEITISNPPYAMLYQSKALLAVMYEMFPESKYLLKTKLVDKDYTDTTPYVLKPVFGREGQNITIVQDGTAREHTNGYYDESSIMIAQELAEFPKDTENRCYQAGVFISMETPCGISFRRSEPHKTIITTDNDLCGHIINYEEYND